MKIQKLTESVFEKLKDATTVINPVTADAVKDNDMREKAVEKILKERGQGKEFTGSSEKTPEVPVVKPQKIMNSQTRLASLSYHE